MIRASQTLSKYLILLTAVLSPAQALQGMHLFCSHCAFCAVDHEVAEGHAEYSCCRKAKTLSDEESAVDIAIGCSPFAPSPTQCPPSCWCRRLAEIQLPSQQRVELPRSVEMVGQSVYATTVALKLELLYVLKDDALPACTAKQTCASLCRFLA